VATATVAAAATTITTTKNYLNKKNFQFTFPEIFIGEILKC
jgi:hypothetical protein